jgi:hypothetical protein
MRTSRSPSPPLVGDGRDELVDAGLAGVPATAIALKGFEVGLLGKLEKTFCLQRRKQQSDLA